MGRELFKPDGPRAKYLGVSPNSTIRRDVYLTMPLRLAVICTAANVNTKMSVGKGESDEAAVNTERYERAGDQHTESGTVIVKRRYPYAALLFLLMASMGLGYKCFYVL